jgi:hypothetical protein
MNKQTKLLLSCLALILVGILVVLQLRARGSGGSLVETRSERDPIPESHFLAPGRAWPSQKKVEEYFAEHLNMSMEEATAARLRSTAPGKVQLRLREYDTLDTLTENLENYGFIRDREALMYALENSSDYLKHRSSILIVGENTIDTGAYYLISEDMSAWEIADVLLNKPNYFAVDEYKVMFVP